MSITFNDFNVITPPSLSTYPRTFYESLSLAFLKVSSKEALEFAILTGVDIRWFAIFLTFDRPYNLHDLIYRLTPSLHGKLAQIELLNKA